MSLVLDSSATLAWIYGDETTEPIRRLFDLVADDGAVVPALWRLEVANSLTVAVRRGRIDAGLTRPTWNSRSDGAFRLPPWTTNCAVRLLLLGFAYWEETDLALSR